jgi:D-alanyl-lipoteichoic acid acyltransferase DltB (MBOAT superfamily)
MLFNSYLFFFGFLPVALAGYELAGRIHRKAVIVWLGLCSLVFYAWWKPELLLILLGSIAFNYLAAELISRSIPSPVSSRVWLYLAVIADLLVLAYYKYFFPTLNGVSAALHLGWHWTNVALPLGISFFTLTQIAFLVDLYKGSAEKQDIPNYLLFVTFFPHLIAGPILHHREMMPQFQKKSFGLKEADFTIGLTWFILGLGKKVLIADSFAKIANPAFNAHAGLQAGSAWLGALAYALQIYFDFSGYSDMALGLARMFSIDFPLNFNSPYKSASIIEAWQRWHMTLARYIFTYIYHPLQRRVLLRRQRLGRGNTRQDRAKPLAFITVVALPLIFTLFVAGVWHGAGPQFMVFGLLQGMYLSVNHAWRQFRRKRPSQKRTVNPAAQFVVLRASVLFTFLCSTVSVVFFRGDSLRLSLLILGSMFGIHGNGVVAHPYADPGSRIPMLLLAKVAMGLAIVWALPNTQQILTRFRPSLEQGAWNDTKIPAAMRWVPTTAWSFGVAVLMFVCLVHLRDASAFLYFQF